MTGKKPSRNPVTTRKGLSANAWTTIAVVVAAVLVIGGVLIFNRSDSGQPESGAVAAEVLNPPGSHELLTKSGATVTMVEFIDYQCPACESYYQNITKSIEKDYAGKIEFVTRNYPLAMHPLAVPAAKAAEAAALQGKYREMYEKLYSDYRTWAVAPDGQNVSEDAARAQGRFDAYAKELGLDLAKFHADEASPAVQKRIDQDKADGDKAGVTSTPTIFVNGVKFEPTGKTYAAVAEELRGKLDKAGQ